MTEDGKRVETARGVHAKCHFGQHYSGRIWNPETEEFQPHYGMTCAEAEKNKGAK